jgi:hypothetical protein
MRGTDSALLASSAPTNFADLSITASTGRVDVASIEGSDATDQINAACDTALTDYDAVVPADLPSNFADLSITASTGRVDVASIEGSDATDQINAACDTAIETYNLDHLMAAACPSNDLANAVADNSALAFLMAIGADISDYDGSTDSLEAIGSAAATATVAAIADAVLEELISDHSGVAGSLAAVINNMADTLWDEVMEAGAPANAQTARQWMRLFAAALFGITGDTGSWSAKSIDEAKVRISATLNSSGHRTETTIDGS